MRQANSVISRCLSTSLERLSNELNFHMCIVQMGPALHTYLYFEVVSYLSYLVVRSCGPVKQCLPLYPLARHALSTLNTASSKLGASFDPQPRVSARKRTCGKTRVARSRARDGAWAKLFDRVGVTQWPVAARKVAGLRCRTDAMLRRGDPASQPPTLQPRSELTSPAMEGPCRPAKHDDWPRLHVPKL